MTEYLIQIDDCLFGYDSLDVLRCDVAVNRPEEFKLFRLNHGRMRTAYTEVKGNALALLLKGREENE